MSRSQHDDHECDLFLLSGHHRYVADAALPKFAREGRRNIDGWGIGFYADGRAQRVVNATRATSSEGTISNEFATAVEAARSDVIVGHLRRASSGAQHDPENNHPFLLQFLGYDWLFAHNGTARKELVPWKNRLLVRATNDSARVFEFLRQHMIDYYEADAKKSLIAACRSAYVALLRTDPSGTFNVLMTNGLVTFAFVHFRTFYLLRREKTDGEVVLLTTISNLSDEQGWVAFDPLPGTKAKMLVFCGPTLLWNADLPSTARRVR